MKKKLIIGITGGSASGKSFYAQNLQKFINELNPSCKVIIISMDNFYKGLSSFNKNEMELFKTNKLNLDCPSIINFNLLIQVLVDLENNIPTQMPIYERMTYDSIATMELTDNYNVIIVEGIFIFNNPDLTNMMDIKIYMDTDELLRLKRRKQRYNSNKLKKQIEYYNQFVIPSFKKYILPQKKIADFIINGGHQFYSTLTPNLLEKIFNII